MHSSFHSEYFSEIGSTGYKLINSKIKYLKQVFFYFGFSLSVQLWKFRELRFNCERPRL